MDHSENKEIFGESIDRSHDRAFMSELLQLYAIGESCGFTEIMVTRMAYHATTVYDRSPLEGLSLIKDCAGSLQKSFRPHARPGFELSVT